MSVNKWIGKDNTVYLPNKMSSEHITNSITYCWSKIADGNEENYWRKWIRIFDKELNKRNNI